MSAAAAAAAAAAAGGSTAEERESAIGSFVHDVRSTPQLSMFKRQEAAKPLAHYADELDELGQWNCELDD
jgi:hypothetical protein